MTFKFFKPPRLQESLHAEFNSNLTPWDVMKTISVMAKFASQPCLPLSHVCLEKIKREAQKIIFKIKMRLWVILSWFLKAMSAAVVAVQVALRTPPAKGKKEKKTQRGLVKRSQHRASRSCEKPFEVSVFLGSPTLHGLEWESVRVFVSVSAKGGCGMEDVLPWQPRMQQWVQRPSSGRCCCSNGGFEEGRWNFIPDCCSEWARSAFWCLVWSTPNGTRVCGGNEAAPAFALHHGTTVSQREDDAGAPLSMWPLALHYIAALCQYCRVSPSHCFLYRLILHNPGNPTVARVKYQAPAVSPLTFFSDVIFLSSFLHTGLQLWKSDTWQVSVGFDWSNFLVNSSGQGAPYIKWDEAMFRWCNVCRSCEKKIPALHWMMNGSKLYDVGDTQQRLKLIQPLLCGWFVYHFAFNPQCARASLSLLFFQV